MKNTRASLKPLNLKDVSEIFLKNHVNLSIKFFITILAIELFLNILYSYILYKNECLSVCMSFMPA